MLVYGSSLTGSSRRLFDQELQDSFNNDVFAYDLLLDLKELLLYADFFFKDSVGNLLAVRLQGFFELEVFPDFTTVCEVSTMVHERVFIESSVHFFKSAF